MLQMKMPTAHPVLFLIDSSPDTPMPMNVAEPVTATDRCLAFWVLSDVDGATRVTVADETPPVEGLQLFDGWIKAPSGILTLIDSGAFKFLNGPVSEGGTGVRIWADDEVNPTWVWIASGSIRYADPRVDQSAARAVGRD